MAASVRRAAGLFWRRPPGPLGPPGLLSPFGPSGVLSQSRGAGSAEQAHEEREPATASAGASAGARFLRQARGVEARRQEIQTKLSVAAAVDRPEAAADPKKVVEQQLQRLFRDLPGHASPITAYALHRRKQLKPKQKEPMEEEDFMNIFTEQRQLFLNSRRTEVRKRRNTRRDYSRLNTGYKEEEPVFEATEEEFGDSWRVKSIAEDYWKAEFYQHLHRKVRDTFPEHRGAPDTREDLPLRTDRLADVLGGALRSHVMEQNRPVLTHELADYENPYIMKRSATERLLHERCVRNQLDERCMPRLLESQPDLVKLRAHAALPPEVLEPLAAFRGDTRWSFDARERLSQKLAGASAALRAVVDSGGDAAATAAALPENGKTRADQVEGLHHPWKNHLGFVSAVPRGFAGGTKFGQPMPAVDEQVLRLRYPTLQRVAHTLPADPKWRAHVVRSIRVLERSKNWDFQSKLNAVNRLKEVYDTLKPSAEYTAALDEKLPVNRVPSHLKRKYARDVQYVKTFRKHFRGTKSFTRYRPSLTARNDIKGKDKKK